MSSTFISIWNDLRISLTSYIELEEIDGKGIYQFPPTLCSRCERFSLSQSKISFFQFFSDPIKNFLIRKNEVFKTRGSGMGVATKAGLLATPQRGREQENARITRQGCSAPWWGWRWWWRWRWGWFWFDIGLIYCHGDDGWFLLEFWSKMIVVMMVMERQTRLRKKFLWTATLVQERLE